MIAGESDLKILRKPNIWDLHIHTQLGTPTKKNYNNDSNEEFINRLLKIYEEADNQIGMISFTDHNQINVEVYDLFRKRSKIAILPGIEMDIYLTEKSINSKHIIFYFNEEELYKLKKLNSLIVDYINENEKVIFEQFVLFLMQHKKKFAVSPHAFKQGKRGINQDWVDENSAFKGVKEFTGLFFPFWEAQGASDIYKAIEFLNEQYTEKSNKHQAVIAFSDSSTYKEVENYINNPNQYFLCLNSYKGLLLAGTDEGRIIYNCEERLTLNPSEKIKSITLDCNLIGKEKERTIIEFSDRLNVIIGGRGKGKSALLDALVYSIEPKKIERDRAKFVKKFNVDIKNFNNTDLVSDMNVIYFSQSYINKLFKGNSSDNLEKFFEKNFSEIEELSDNISDIQIIFEEELNNKILEKEEINIVDDLKNLAIISESENYIKIKKRNSKNILVHKKKRGYAKIIKEMLPTDSDVWNEEVEDAFNKFIGILISNIYNHNYQELMRVKYSNLFRNKLEQRKSKKSKEMAKKNESRQRIEQKLKSIYCKELDRIRQINALYKVPQEMTKMEMKYITNNGEKENLFYFVIAINKEHPVEYAYRCILEAINKNIKRQADKMSYDELFRMYVFDDEFSSCLKDSYTLDIIQNKINSFETLKHEKTHKIIYKAEQILDLHQTSPGTQTNAIMELILHTESTIPLFLDQPEDNIDNEARYEKLTKWIREQKYKRQIILVTHDANLVINGDAECVIVAEHDSERFVYKYGALEYGDILEKSSIILDGGKVAVKRRIEKYGE